MFSKGQTVRIAGTGGLGIVGTVVEPCVDIKIKETIHYGRGDWHTYVKEVRQGVKVEWSCPFDGMLVEVLRPELLELV